MPLHAQRFRDNATLNRCVDVGYRMHRGEPDTEAVKRLQLALFDLGYPNVEIDGIWGDDTSAAVVAFKTDESLRPNDAVASRGTIGRLDTYFAWEPAWPDDPDPSADGLLVLAEEVASTAASYCQQSIAVLDTVTWGQPAASPDQDPMRWALRAHVGVDADDADVEVRRARLVKVLSEMAVSLIPITGDFELDAMDRAAWNAQGYSFYWAYAHLPPRLTVTPAFRNALPATERVATLLRLAARRVDPSMTTYAFPDTARYALLTPQQRATNPVGLASLVLFLTGGITDGNQPPPTWGDLSSFPL